MRGSVVSPRVRRVPEYSSSSGDDAIEFAESYGLHLDVWEQQCVRDILADGENGRWAAQDACLVVPRQNGKGAVLEAIELADVFLFDSKLVVHTAQEFKTAQEAFRRVRGWIEGSPELMAEVKRNPKGQPMITTGNGNEGIELKSGARLRFLARSKHSIRGFTCDRLIFDEAYELSDDAVAAAMPALTTSAHPQTLYTSSAPLLSSTVLRRLVDKGRGDAPVRGFCYLEYSADPKADLDDHAAWRQANPGYEVGRVTDEFVQSERDSPSMSDVAFARERLGIIEDSLDGAVVDLDAWGRQGDKLTGIGTRLCFAVDVPPDASHSSIAVCGFRPDGKKQVEVVKRSRGTGWVVDWLEERRDKFAPLEIVLDPKGPAGSLLPGFKVAGVDVTPVSMDEHVKACALFKADVESGELFHKDQPGLTASLEAARRRRVNDAGGWLWNRRDETDISPLVACTLANFSLSRQSREPDDTRMFFMGR